MKDYNKIVKSLRHCPKAGTRCEDCAYTGIMVCYDVIKEDAADAIEELQAEVERLKDGNEELREKQTFIDQWGAKWATSAKDVPTSAYQHGYADGFAEATQRLESKHGEWIDYVNSHCECSVCHAEFNYFDNCTECFNYCPHCGAKMGVQE